MKNKQFSFVINFAVNSYHYNYNLVLNKNRDTTQIRSLRLG